MAAWAHNWLTGWVSQPPLQVTVAITGTTSHRARVTATHGPRTRVTGWTMHRCRVSAATGRAPGG